MGEPAYESLPVVLVSAKDNAAALHIISEIIDNDATDTYKAIDGDAVQDRVWRIANKYYTADVRLQASGDEQLPEHDDPVDAHIIYLQEDECSVSACTRRCVRGGHVRLVLGARLAAVRAWAAQQRYEPVALAADDGDDGDGDGDGDARDYGVARVRCALQAHAWRGLRRTDRGPALHAGPGSAGSAGAVERAELFAAALGALPAAAGLARGEGDRELRLARAEALLHEFCRALGDDLDL